jgi:hypothetical protein
MLELRLLPPDAPENDFQDWVLPRPEEIAMLLRLPDEGRNNHALSKALAESGPIVIVHDALPVARVTAHWLREDEFFEGFGDYVYYLVWKLEEILSPLWSELPWKRIERK